MKRITMKGTSFKNLIYKYRYLLLQAYWLIYLPWFGYLENTVTTHFHVIHMDLDDSIPFISIFCIPYFLWFGYVAIAFCYTYLHDKQEYLRTCAFLYMGMTIFLIVSTVYPNGHYMRNSVVLGDGIFRCLAIGDRIEYQCHEQSSHHIKDRVLFDKYGR